jgi:hypothetical protein
VNRFDWREPALTAVLSVIIAFLAFAVDTVIDLEHRVDNLDINTRDVIFNGRRLDRLEERLYK